VVQVQGEFELLQIGFDGRIRFYSLIPQRKLDVHCVS